MTDTTTLEFTFPHTTITITDVPADIHQKTGEKLIYGPHGMAISDLVNEIAQILEKTPHFHLEKLNPPGVSDVMKFHSQK